MEGRAPRTAEGIYYSKLDKKRGKMDSRDSGGRRDEDTFDGCVHK